MLSLLHCWNCSFLWGGATFTGAMRLRRVATADFSTLECNTKGITSATLTQHQEHSPPIPLCTHPYCSKQCSKLDFLGCLLASSPSARPTHHRGPKALQGMAPSPQNLRGFVLIAASLSSELITRAIINPCWQLSAPQMCSGVLRGVSSLSKAKGVKKKYSEIAFNIIVACNYRTN